MTYRVRIDPVALDQIEQFAAWLSDYSEDFAIEQIERLDGILRLNLGEPRSHGATSQSPAHLTARISFVLAAGPSTGSYTPLMKMPVSSISCCFGVPVATRNVWTCAEATRITNAGWVSLRSTHPTGQRIPQKRKAPRKERLSHRWTVILAARTPREITANSTCRIRPGAGSFRSARLRSSSARCSCR